LDPERVHNAFTLLGNKLGKQTSTKWLTNKLFNYHHHSLEQKIFGIKFKNPVGLAAGFDKDANLTNILADVGFGFMHVGSVTFHSYQGNPRPRLYRLPKSKGLVVYYGLKNIGVEKIIAKLQNQEIKDFPIGISIAKTNSDRTVKVNDGIEDYKNCLNKLNQAGIGEFYTINISCPNTFGGEPFTTPKRLNRLLSSLASLSIQKPLLLKMPINLNWKEFDKLLTIAIKHKIKGVIIGNLNKDRSKRLIKDRIPRTVKGGISGKPTWDLSNQLISKTYKHYRNELVIIGVGGIFSAKNAYEKIKRGATLVQLITGMIFIGPQLIGEINRGLVKLLKNDRYTSISQAVGTYHS
jgi:dihydroorotate dehydrogenase subfamily 2